MPIIAFFVAKDNAWDHWSWITYFLLTAALLLIELYDDWTRNLSPIAKAPNYLEDHSDWSGTDSDNYTQYYKPAPEFTLRTDDDESNLDFTQEWTRGEIGSHYSHGNAAYYRDIYIHDTRLKRIHVVLFDGGKKTIVAPTWEALGAGRIYFYLKDSIEYAYQRYLIQERGEEHSRGIRQSGFGGTFDIPVFEGLKEVQRFVTYCNEQTRTPASDANEQVEIFFSLLRKYQDFKQGRLIR